EHLDLLDDRDGPTRNIVPERMGPVEDRPVHSLIACLPVSTVELGIFLVAIAFRLARHDRRVVDCGRDCLASAYAPVGGTTRGPSTAVNLQVLPRRSLRGSVPSRDLCTRTRDGEFR